MAQTWKTDDLESQKRKKEEYVHPVDLFFYDVSRTIKKFKPETIDRLKKAMARLVTDAKYEEKPGKVKVENDETQGTIKDEIEIVQHEVKAEFEEI